MKVVATLAPELTAPPPPRARRARRHPRAGAVLFGSCALFVAFIAFMGFAWKTGEMLLTGDRQHGLWALGLLAVFGFARLLAFVNNDALTCSLCHGTILHEKRCRKHAEATRIPGLSHRAATVVAVLCTGSFRCMYCGTPYRLKK
jgi:hypothetical protein